MDSIWSDGYSVIERNKKRSATAPCFQHSDGNKTCTWVESVIPNEGIKSVFNLLTMLVWTEGTGLLFFFFVLVYFAFITSA